MNSQKEKGYIILKGESVKIKQEIFSPNAVRVTLLGTFIFRGVMLRKLPFMQIDIRSEQGGLYSCYYDFSYFLPKLLPIRSFREFLIPTLGDFTSAILLLRNPVVDEVLKNIKKDIEAFSEIGCLLKELTTKVISRFKDDDAALAEKILAETKINRNLISEENPAFWLKTILYNLKPSNPEAESIARKVLEIFGCGTALDVGFRVE